MDEMEGLMGARAAGEGGLVRNRPVAMVQCGGGGRGAVKLSLLYGCSL